MPDQLLVVGGGYIGMELGSVYASLGSKVTLIEALDGILTGADKDLIRPVMATAKAQFDRMMFNTKLKNVHKSRQR